MLNILYLVLIILSMAGQNVARKPYTKRVGGNGVYTFSTILTTAALVFFAATTTELNFNFSFVPYSIAFALFYAIATVFMVLAIAHGSLSLSSLFLSYSLLLPTFYGLIFLKDPISKGFVPGLIFLLISLALVNKTDEKAKFSLKWIVYVLLTFVGNGMCTIIQKMQQMASKGAYKNEFMIVALAIVVVVLFVISLVKERKDAKTYIKAGWHWALICGILNGMANLFIMILSSRMSISLMFPLVSAGGLIVTFFVSTFFYKEKLTKTQIIGFIFGLVAVVFLNI